MFLIKTKTGQVITRKQIVNVLLQVSSELKLFSLSTLDSRRVERLFGQYTTAVTSGTLAVITFLLAGLGLYAKLIVELKSYLPIIFYENGKSDIANQMIIDLCSVENKRRDYPENSFTIIEHLTRGLLGIQVDATSNTFSTLSRTEDQKDWVEMKQVPLLSNKINIKHEGHSTSTAINTKGLSVYWSAQFLGNHEFLYVNGEKTETKQIKSNGKLITYCKVKLIEGNKTIVSITP
jgi:hypothetical protein